MLSDSEISARTFILSDDVDSDSVKPIIKGILEINYSDNKNEKSVVDFKREPIKIYINSCGGYLSDGWALIDIMLSSKTPITTITIGKAWSMGMIIFLAGSNRLVGKHAEIMYHEAAGEWKGYLTDAKETVDGGLKRQNVIDRFVIERTDLTQEQLNPYKERKSCWYMNSDEAIKYNVATGIYTGGIK